MIWKKIDLDRANQYLMNIVREKSVYDLNIEKISAMLEFIYHCHVARLYVQSISHVYLLSGSFIDIY